MVITDDAITELERLDAVVRDVQVVVCTDRETVIKLGRMRDELWQIIAQIKRDGGATRAEQPAHHVEMAE